MCDHVCQNFNEEMWILYKGIDRLFVHGMKDQHKLFFLLKKTPQQRVRCKCDDTPKIVLPHTTARFTCPLPPILIYIKCTEKRVI
jgi:hypothetical protein